MKQYCLHLFTIAAVVILLVSGTGCKKFLDARPDKSLAVPSTLQDFQALLDYYPYMLSDPAADEASADNYYLTTTSWQAIYTEENKRSYTWEKDRLFAAGYNDWGDLYRKIYYANTVLDNISGVQVTNSNQATWNNVKGQALLVRGRSFLQGAGIWAMAYDESSAGGQLGLPLRLTADMTQPSVRASLQQTYAQIISDLTEAVPLLPAKAIHPSRPSRAAAYALLARTFLYMHRYTEAATYSDSCLALQHGLLDYNTLNPNEDYPIPQFNEEEILYSSAYRSELSPYNALVDSSLYASYEADDLRRTIFFRDNGNGTVAFKGSYDGYNGGLFTGMATDEVYLMRAECRARAGDITNALADLNTLLVKRYKTATFKPVTGSDKATVLNTILAERRKELLMRCTRWMDIKRLNSEGRNIILNRLIDGKLYTLPPGDKRYALPIPEEIIAISQMPQNPR